jgi:hypothetical protein
VPLGYFIKPEAWDAQLTNFILAAVHSPLSRTTRITLHMFLKDELQDLLRRLQSLKHLSRHALLVPLILMEPRTEFVVRKLERIRLSLYRTEKIIGTHKNYNENIVHERNGYYARGDRVWNHNEDFDRAPGQLTSMVSDCVMFEAIWSINEHLLDWLETLNSQLPTGMPGNRSCIDYTSALIKTKLSTTRIWVSNTKIRSQYFAKRAEAQVQSVSTINNISAPTRSSGILPDMMSCLPRHTAS